MKTVLTFTAACLFTLATMAADHNPTVTINSKRHFEFVVDGRQYYHDNFVNLDRLCRGPHTIEVYEHSPGFFGTHHRLISSRTFIVRNNDLIINVDYSGFLYVNEIGNGWGRNRRWYDRGYDDRDWDHGNRDWDHDDRDWNHDDRDWNHNDHEYDRNMDHQKNYERSRGF